MERDYIGMGHFNDPAHPELKQINQQSYIKFLEMRLMKLEALEDAGVDNWEYYDLAMEGLLK